MYSVHTFPPYVRKIHSNIIFLSMPRSSEWSLSFWILNQNFVHISHLSHAYYMTHQSNFGIQYLFYPQNIMFWKVMYHISMDTRLWW